MPWPKFYCFSLLKQKQKKTTKSFEALFQCINPLNPKIKIKILIWFVAPIHLLKK